MVAVRFVRALALAAVLLPGAAMADDPADPLMRDPAARARDKAIIRQLNQEELARVQARDAQYAAGWRAYRERAGDGSAAEHAGRQADYERANRAYARERAAYDRDMARWRAAVAACRAGDYSACEG